MKQKHQTKQSNNNTIDSNHLVNQLFSSLNTQNLSQDELPLDDNTLCEMGKLFFTSMLKFNQLINRSKNTNPPQERTKKKSAVRQKPTECSDKDRKARTGKLSSDAHARCSPPLLRSPGNAVHDDFTSPSSPGNFSSPNFPETTLESRELSGVAATIPGSAKGVKKGVDRQYESANLRKTSNRHRGSQNTLKHSVDRNVRVQSCAKSNQIQGLPSENLFDLQGLNVNKNQSYQDVESLSHFPYLLGALSGSSPQPEGDATCSNLSSIALLANVKANDPTPTCATVISEDSFTIPERLKCSTDGKVKSRQEKTKRVNDKKTDSAGFRRPGAENIGRSKSLDVRRTNSTARLLQSASLFHIPSTSIFPSPNEMDDNKQRLNLNIFKFVDDCMAQRDSDIRKLDTALAEDADTFTFDDKTLMLRAAFSGDVALLRSLNVDASYIDDVGRSAIHYASVSGSMECVRYLIECGADIDLVDKKDWSALHIAVSKNYTDVARVLIDSGCNIFKQLRHRCAPSRLVDVYSFPIHFAAIKGNIELTKVLLDHGADINELDSANMTPLHYAAFRSNLPYLQFLLDLGADGTIKDSNGRTAFHTAALSGFVDNMRLLINKFNFINDPDIWSLSPLTLAKLRQHTDLINYLNGLSPTTPKNSFIGTLGDEICIDVDIDGNSVNTYDDMDEMTMMLSSTIASALQEPNVDQIYRCVYRIGADLSKTIFDLTLQIERNGGVLTADGKRRRTPGGIFFTLLKELYANEIISKDDYNYIRAAENEKRCAKAIERRNKPGKKNSAIKK